MTPDRKRCPACSYVIPPTVESCPSCGVSVVEGSATSTTVLGRPLLDSFLGVVNIVLGAAMALVAAFVLVKLGSGGGTALVLALLVAGIVIASGLFLIASGIGLWRLRPYGRYIQLVWAAVGFLNFPFGTIVSIMLFKYFTLPGIVLLYSGRSLEELDDDERFMIRRDSSSLLGTTLLFMYLVPFVFIGVVVAWFLLMAPGTAPPVAPVLPE